MPDLTFGKQLRKFRLQCHYPETGEALTQQQLGALLREEIGISYTGAAISEWERDKAKPSINDRLVLTSLIKILKQYGGINSLADANLLLESGSYRDLKPDEREKIFLGEIEEQQANQQPTTPPKELTPNLKFLLGSILFDSPEEFQKVIDEANAGPEPWPNIAVSVINKITRKWSIFHVLKVLIWAWVWLLTYLFLIPSLHLPFSSHENAILALTLYLIGTTILPSVIGAMVNTKDKTYWKEQNISNAFITRLYVHQGAYIGFHLGYFFLFPLALLRSQFHIQSTAWVEFIMMSVPILISYTSAHLVPYNLRRAYGKLSFKDGYIFFIFVILGPIWAWFLFTFYEMIGIVTLLTAITLLTIVMAIQYQRKGNTVIPLLWVIIFYGLIFICQIVSVFIQ